MGIKAEELPLRFGLPALNASISAARAASDAKQATDAARFQLALGSADQVPAFADQSPSALEPVYRAIGRMVVARLRKQAGGASLHWLANEMITPIQELMPVAEWLERHNYANITERPLNGDWRLTLTDEGQKLV